ncbi:MAG: Gfo/Idh/MocA family oxidoreductase [Candidatus Bathyarchaeia archaeon]
MMEVVKVCIVGAGRTGEVHGRNLTFRIREAKVVAVVDQNVEAAKRLASLLGGVNYYDSLTDAIRKEDFDAVFITTPTFTHCPLTVEAAEAGKHVFCEKPIALNLEEADKMISTARKHNIKLQIGFMRRFDPEIRKAKQLVDEGVIGRPILMKSLSRGPGLPPKWALDPKTGLAMIAEVSIHDFDSILWFMPNELNEVYSVANPLIHPELAKEYPGYHDTYAAIMKFKGGEIGIVDGACPVGYAYDARLEILGTEGLIMIGEVKGTTMLTCHKDKKIITEPFASWRDRFRDGYLNEAESFIKAIIEDKEPEVTGEDGRRALEAVLAAVESIKTNSPIKLPLK